MTDYLRMELTALLNRSNDVRDWPADEQELHRGWTGDFTSRHAAVIDLRVDKILALVLAPESFRPTCTRCGGDLDFLDSPGGAWFAHVEHPADEHDAEPNPNQMMRVVRELETAHSDYRDRID